MPTLPTRADVPLETTWDLSDLFADQAAWAAECEAIETACAALPAWHGRVGADGATLRACLEATEALHVRLMRVGTFAHLLNAGDATQPAHQSAVAQVAALKARVEAATSFVDDEILALPVETLQRLRDDEPGLGSFDTLFDDLLALRPHRLSAETEQALAALGEVLDAPYLVYGRCKFGDMRFEPFTDAAGTTHANSFNAYESRFETHDDTSVRRGAWASFTAGLRAHHHTSAASFATEVNKHVALARLRGYPSTESSLLQPHKIPHTLYHDILDIIQAELAPHMQRCARLRQRVLGLDRLLYCDLKAPLDPAFNPPMPWDESCRLVLHALEPLGPEYLGFVQQALSQRWVDRADNLGKSSGAFCASPHGVHPYILITWSDTMRNVFTLAHELGHGGHFALAMKHQRYVNTRPAAPFIEAPSIMNEMLLAQHILAGSQERRLRRSVILQVLGTYHHNFVTHLLEAELQRQVFALAEGGGSITAAVLDDCQGRILERFWGDTLTLDEGARMTWMRQPHFYMGLYPYTYSVGLVAATALALKFQQEGASVLQRWLEVLKAGGTRSPLALLAWAGVDLSTPQPIHEAVAHVGRLVDELEASFD